MSDVEEPVTNVVDSGVNVGGSPGDSPDLDGIARDLADVEAALGRLNAGTYWTDEVSGRPIDQELLIAEPLRRTAEAGSTSVG